MSAKIGKNFLIRFLNKFLLKFGLLIQKNKLNELFIKKFKENKGIKFNYIFKSVSNNDFDSIIFCVLNNLYDKKFKNIELAKLKKFDDNTKKYLFDVGAHNGESIERFKKIFPNSVIYSFEPIKKLSEELKKKYQCSNIKIFNYALDSTESIKNFNIYKKTKSSSLNKIVNKNWLKEKKEYFKKNQEINILNMPQDKDYEVQEVETIKLDKFLLKNNEIDEIDLLKIDVQGSEEEVLKGCESALKNQKIKVIEAEVYIGKLYHSDQILKMNQILDKYDYKILAIDKASNLLAGRYYYFNTLFVNNEIYKKIHEEK